MPYDPPLKVMRRSGMLGRLKRGVLKWQKMKSSGYDSVIFASFGLDVSGPFMRPKQTHLA